MTHPRRLESEYCWSDAELSNTMLRHVARVCTLCRPVLRLALMDQRLY